MNEPARPALRVGMCVVEAGDPLPTLDLTGADDWHILITLGGVPCGYTRIASPGATTNAGIANAAVVRQADWLHAHEQFTEMFRARLGGPTVEPKEPSCSVVVCTRRRSEYLPDALHAVGRMDPPPLELIVVDNDPGDADCRAEVEQAGARYVREDRRGLDNARNAGLRVARGDLVAFTDDDCVPPPTWLRALGDLFADPAVAAVTGPAFAHSLDTPAQVRFEEQGGHRRGLGRRSMDWRRLAPIESTRAGAGLNMVFRRSVLDELGEVFPPELDAGTPTECGGDTYALYRILAAGHRIVYDPGTYVFHKHRPSSKELHRAIRGYGVGLSAVLAKLVLEERELTAPRVWNGLWWLYRDAVRRGLAGAADPVEVRIGWDYLAGGFLGARAWWRARRHARAAAAGAPTTRPIARRVPHAPPRRPPSEEGVGVSVIVSVSSGPEALARCREALALQEPEGLAFETIVTGAGGLPSRNAAAASARGEILLFVDDELVPQPHFVAAHVERHRTGADERVVIGRCAPRAAEGRLAELYEKLRWDDHFERKRTAPALTFADFLSMNMSVPRKTFERLGGFDACFEEAGREGWEWGLRVLEEGVEVCYEQDAVAALVLSTDARTLLEWARREGEADGLLRRRHPGLAASLELPGPARRRATLAHPVEGLASFVLRRHGARRAAAPMLDGLELLRARGAWLRLFERTRRAAYEEGAIASGCPLTGTPTRPLAVELASEEPIPAPRAAPPVVELTIGGQPAGRLTPDGGQWHRSLADRAADAAWARLGELPLRRLPAFEETPEGRDLSRAIVVFGSGCRKGDDLNRGAFEAQGARVEVLTGGLDDHWRGLDRAIRESPLEVVALPMPGVVPSPAWLESAAVALDGDRVAVAVGAGLDPGVSAQPLFLGSRRLLPDPYPVLGGPAQYLVVRRSLYEALGGFDLGTVPLGPQAPPLDLLERALEAGYVVAHRDTPGLEPPGSSGHSRRQWQRHQARGGLLWRRARAMGGSSGWWWLGRRGLLPLCHTLSTSMMSGWPSRTYAFGSAAAFMSGCLVAVRGGIGPPAR